MQIILGEITSNESLKPSFNSYLIEGAAQVGSSVPLSAVDGRGDHTVWMIPLKGLLHAHKQARGNPRTISFTTCTRERVVVACRHRRVPQKRHRLKPGEPTKRSRRAPTTLKREGRPHDEGERENGKRQARQCVGEQPVRVGLKISKGWTDSEGSPSPRHPEPTWLEILLRDSPGFVRVASRCFDSERVEETDLTSLYCYPCFVYFGFKAGRSRDLYHADDMFDGCPRFLWTSACLFPVLSVTYGAQNILI